MPVTGHRQINQAPQQRTEKTVILIAFLLSGLMGLVYETIWMRMLTLVFGSTTLAVSTALAAFMAGLALGSYALGKFADKAENHLKIYVILEILVGLYGLTTLVTLPNLDKIYGPLVGLLSGDFYLLTAARFILAFLVIGIGAFLMGGTLPVISRIIIKEKNTIGEQFASIYAINTLGAVFGVLLAGYFLIPVMGLRSAIGIAALGNFVIAAGCFLFFFVRDKNTTTLTPPPKKVAPTILTGTSDPTGNQTLLLTAFAISGFASLACQVLWTRTLTLIIGSSVYAFTIMLATFLFGIAAGSMIVVALFPRLKHKPYFWLGLCQLGVAFSILLGTVLIGKLPQVFLSLSKWLPHNFLGNQLVEFFVTSLAILPATLLMGAAFPLVCRIYAGSGIDNLGSRIGMSYAINTIGAVIGAVAAGFILIPAIGAENSFQILAAMNMLIGFIFLVHGAKANIWPWVAGGSSVVAGILIAVLSPAWNYVLVQGNLPYLVKVFIERPEIIEKIASGKVLYRDEDISGSAMVYQMYDGSINLNLSGHNEGGTHAGDMNGQIEEAMIPLLLHKSPRKVLLVGLGTGIALGVLLQSDEVEQIDVLEISSGAVKANHFFAPYNNNALKDKRVNIIIDDGRHYMANTKKKYDLVLNTPSYSWVSGTANIFTQDFFKLARARLAPGGIFVSWFQLYGITPPDIKRFAKTVNSVFPQTSLWLTSSSTEFIALGSEQPLEIDYSSIKKKLAAKKLASELARISVPIPESILGLYLMSGKKLTDYVAGSEINTDDHPVMEFSIPRGAYSWNSLNNIQSFVGSKYAAFLPVQGMALQQGDSLIIPSMGLKSYLPDWVFSANFANMFDYPGGVFQRRTEVKLAYQKPPYAFEMFVARGNPTAEQMKAELEPLAREGGIQSGQFAGRTAYWTRRLTAKNEEIFVTWACKEGNVSFLGRFSAPVSGQGNHLAWSRLAKGLQCY